MNNPPKQRHWRVSLFLWIGMPFIALVGFRFAPDLPPAWQAQSGGGVLGTFTATEEECGRRSCDFVGDWTAADGSAERTNVVLYDEPDDLRVGGSTPARDTGATTGVFSTAGGYTYLLATAFVLGGAGCAIAWPIFLWRTFRDLWARRRGVQAWPSPPPAASADGNA